nr:hypothetical protein [Candidatus Freyarchaeota archaeon]
MDYTDIPVGQIPNIREVVQRFFEWNEFRVEWKGEYLGVAKKGSLVMNIAFRSFSQYYEIGFEISILQDQTAVIRVSKQYSGAWGGLIGVHMADKQYNEIVEKMSAYFNAMAKYKGSGDATTKN